MCMSNSEADTERRTEVLRGHAEIQSRTSNAVSISPVRRRRERLTSHSVFLLHQYDGRDHDAGEELRFAPEFHSGRLYVPSL